MSLLKLYRRFRWIDWLFLIAILGITFLQVWCTMLMTDKIQGVIQGIETGLVNQDNGPIWQNALLYALFAFISMLCSAGNAVLASAITANFGINLRKEIYDKVSSFSLEETSRFSTASLITRTSNDLDIVQMSSLVTFRMFFSAPITAVWAIVKIRSSSAELTWVTVVGIIAIIVVLLVVLCLVGPKFKLSQKLVDRLNLVTRETVTGIRVVRAYNAEDYQQEKFQKANDDLTKLNLFTSRLTGLFDPVITIVLDGVTIGIYFVGAGLINGFDNILQKGEMYSTMVAFTTLAVQVIMAFMMLLMMFIMLPRALVAAKRISEVLDTEASIVNPKEAKDANGAGTIEFDHVSFTYAGADKPMLKDISFKANQGDTVAVIGATGCGKTTLVNLISRLYDATEGSVKIDGADVKELNQEDLRSRIGFVPQKGLLFSGTVASNICFGLSEIDQARMEEAAEVSCSSEFISKMDKGFESAIAQGGTNVSGGQRQRLCIARACAVHPEIFVFDDSFSALDFKTDRLVRNNLKQTYPNATKVIVAQRVGTIMDADLILVLENGAVVGKGTHRQLLQDCPTYRDIALSQLSKEELGL